MNNVALGMFGMKILNSVKVSKATDILGYLIFFKQRKSVYKCYLYKIIL